VAQFVGQDRVLRRLSLQRVGDLELEPVPADGAAPSGSVSASTPVRGAVSLMLEAEDPRLVVTGDDGAPLGVVTLELVHDAVRREAAAGAPDPAVS
jgi:osmoprotectant transport system ATP-binding protein